MALTSIPGINDALLGKSLFLGQGALLESIFTGGDTLSFTQSNTRLREITLTASNILIITQLADHNIITRTANNTIGIIQTAHFSQQFILTASNSLIITQNAASNIVTRSSSDSITITHSARTFAIVAGAIALTASSPINFPQTNNKFLIKASGFDRTASHSLTFTLKAVFPIELTAKNTSTFVGSTLSNAGKSGTLEITFTQTVVAGHFRSITASNSISFPQNFTWVQLRNGIPVLGVGGCSALYEYAPFSGGDSTPIVRPVAPILQKKTDVFFFFPSGPICEATTSITLRTPNFGDRDRNQYNRINRESRGGTLQIFRDPKWPSERTLVMDFSGIKDLEITNIMTFLETTLGQKVGFRDWHGRVFFGIIMTPDTTITKTGTNRNDLVIELEVDNLLLEVNACDTVIFTQTNAVVKLP